MNKAVSWRTGSVFPGKAAAGGQSVAEFDQGSRRIRSRVRGLHAMMQVNLDFTPSRVAMFCETIDESLVIFLRRIKIRVTQRLAFIIPPGAYSQGIFAAPICQTAFLFAVIHRGCRRVAAVHGFKVVCHADH